MVYVIRSIGGALDVHYVPFPESLVGPRPSIPLVNIELVSKPLLHSGAKRAQLKRGWKRRKLLRLNWKLKSLNL